jgi:hypothetical protein
MRRSMSMHTVLVAAFAFGSLALACSNGTSSAGRGTPTLTISSPSDGASVSEPFTLKLDASVPLGDPSTGEDHVHLCFDGASCDTGNYVKVYSDTTQVQGLSPGQHTIEASLRNADHSAIGPTTTITVTVTGGATGSPTGGPYGSSSSPYSRY